MLKKLPEKYNSCILNQYFDNTGRHLFTENSHDQKSFIGDDSLAWFRFGSTYRIRGKSGRLHKTFRFFENKHFMGICDNLLVFGKEEEFSRTYSAYDLNDKLIFQITLSVNLNLKGVYKLSENLFGLTYSDANYLFCDSAGKIMNYSAKSGFTGLIASDFSFFDRNEYVVKDNNTSLLGVINRNGEIIIDFKYKLINEFITGQTFCITKEDEKQFINHNGKNLIDVSTLITTKALQYHYSVLREEIQFKDGLCLGLNYGRLHYDSAKGKQFVTLLDGFFYFDENGKEKITLGDNIVFAGNFSEGFAPIVDSSGALGFIDKTGKWKIKPIYELSIAGSYPFPYLFTPNFVGGYVYIKSFKGYIDIDGNEYFSGKIMKDKYNFSH